MLLTTPHYNQVLGYLEQLLECKSKIAESRALLAKSDSRGQEKVWRKRGFMLQLGNGSDLKTARGRVANNDRPNAEQIEQSSKGATHIIPSMPYVDPTAL